MLGQLRGCVDALLSVDVSGLVGRRLVEALEALEVQRRRLAAVDQRLLVQANDTALAAGFGQPGLAGVLGLVLRLDGREARARVDRASDLGARRALTGPPLPPTLPQVAEAVQRGELGAGQVDVILEAIGKLPSCVPVAAVPVVERVLVEAARVETPRQLRRTATALLARLDPDGLEPGEEQARRHAHFSLIVGRDGCGRASGVLDVETTAAWLTILDALSAPRPAEDGTPDPRSAAQRRHDALGEVAQRILRSNTLPCAGGAPVTILATTTMTDLATAAGLDPAAAGLDPEPTASPLDPEPGRLDLGGVDLPELLGSRSGGLAVLGHGQLITAKSLLAMACEARIVPVVFNDAGGVLAYGRTQRLATAHQRLALAARDGGCSFPGCDRPAPWTEVHHVREWINDGPTDLDNLCLLCRYHHRSFDRDGWTVHIRNQTPEWTPPPWLDPTQTPRRNTTHHLPDLEFRPPPAA